jgi:two-component system, NtrC family, sensor histidine kinase HydH
MWKKVIAPTILVSVLWIAVSGATMIYLSRVDEALTHELEAERKLILGSEKMLEYLWRMQAAVVEAEEHNNRGVKTEVARLESAFQKALDRATREAETPEKKQCVNAIARDFADYQKAMERRFQSKGPEPSGEKTLHQAQMTAKACEELFELGERSRDAALERRASLRETVNLIRLGFLVAGSAMGILLGFWIARGLHRTISQISVSLKDASGNLRQELASIELYEDNPHDLPSLHQQVQEVADHIRQVVTELQRARQDALRAERLAAVGELAAGVAHEIRNPLTSVKLLLQNASKKGGEAALKGKNLEIVGDEVARMERTIQRLLDFARPPRLHRRVHDLSSTIRRALQLTRGLTDMHKVQVIEHYPETPVWVDGDPEQLDRVFINLIMNSIDAMAAGGNLCIDLKSGKNGTCQVAVSDTGPGIPPDILQRIFEPFVTTKDKGVGLGLAISRRVIQEHQGTLEASNPPEGGACFVVELPRVAGRTLANDMPKDLAHQG